jgi:CHAD domain-containing protein
MQTELQHFLEDTEPGSPSGRVAKRWNKRGEKLRRALRPVREADVCLGKLAHLRASQAEPNYATRYDLLCQKQISQLEDQLTRVRRSAARKLSAAIQERQERWLRLNVEVEAAFVPHATAPAGATQRAIAELIQGLAAELPALSADHLHEFRKRVKNIRYLADLRADSDALAARQSASLGRIQIAIGEWHDWQVLARKAEDTLRGRSKGEALVDLLRTMEAESLQKALGVCRRSIANLLRHGEHHAGAPRQQPAAEKLPVCRVEAGPASGQRNCA